MPVDAPTSRFFVALRPDDEGAARLGSLATVLATRCRGRALAAHDLHLTLAFIGARPVEDGDALLALLRGLPSQAPGFTVDAVGRFGRGLLWAAPSQAPPFLVTLSQSVRQRLDAGRVDFDRRPLRPHLTLVRNARDRDAERSAVGPCEPIDVASWSLALGGTHPAATPARRYEWRELARCLSAS